MSALKTTTGEPALRGQPIAHDQLRVLLGQVMGFVALTVGASPNSAPTSAEI
jgi:hypothetical protein